jgi:hypothetical protein
MKLAVDVAEAFVGDVSVDLGSGYALMTEDFLNGSQISSLA